MSRKARELAALLLLTLSCVTACTTLAPWERGRFAKPQMASEPDPPQRALREHTYRSREAATIGGAGQGGGCGCY
jgi:hypothetical protein